MSKSTFAFCLLTLASLVLRESTLAQQPGTLRWAVPVDYTNYNGSIESCAPAIGADGTIYVSNGRSDAVVGPSNLYAISPQGTTNWVFTAGGNLRSSPALAADGTIYIGSLDQNLYAVSPTGSTNWVFHTDGWINSSPALAADGTIYIAALANQLNRLYAVNPDGTAKWVFDMLPLAMSIYQLPPRCSSPGIGPDGTIYIGSVDTNLYAINPNGTGKWVCSLGRASVSSPAIGADGTIYIGADNGWHAFTPDGVERWSALSGGVDQSAMVGQDGTVYVGRIGGSYALNPQGTVLWEAPGYSGSCALAADGTCYCVDRTKLYALSATGATLWSRDLLGYSASMMVASSPTIGPDGTVYIVSGQYLRAFYGSSPAQQSPWPMLHRDQMHNARAVQRGLSAPARQPDGNFALKLGLDIGRTYELQASSDLASWTPLTNFISPSSTVQFIDQSATNYPQRFYRLTLP